MVRLPWSLAMISTRSCCHTPTHEYVVPRSIPIAGPSPFPAIEWDFFWLVAKKREKEDRKSQQRYCDSKWKEEVMKWELAYIVRVSVFLEYSIESLDLIGHNLQVCGSIFTGPWACSGPHFLITISFDFELKITFLTMNTSYWHIKY